jgi:hypothetical protein
MKKLSLITLYFITINNATTVKLYSWTVARTLEFKGKRIERRSAQNFYRSLCSNFILNEYSSDAKQILDSETEMAITLHYFLFN